MDGVVLYQGRGHLYLFDSFMLIAKPDDGSVELTVFQADNSNNVLSSSTITLFVHDQDSHFVRGVEQTLSRADPTIRDITIRNAPEYLPTQSSYLLVGLGTDIIARLSMLHPRRVTVLNLDAAACNVLGGVEIVHCVPPSRPLDLTHSLYFDVAILSYTDMLNIWQNSADGHKGASVDILYDTIVQMTRRSVWIMVPHADTFDANSHWNMHLHSMRDQFQLASFSREFFTNITLAEYHRIDKTEGLLNVTIEEVLQLHGIDVFVQSCNTPASAQGDNSARLNTGTNDANAPAQPMPVVSTIVASNSTLGNVHVHIQNACLLKDGNTVVVFTEPRGVGMSIWDELTAMYAQDENNGFQFTPIRFSEVSLTKDSDGMVATFSLTFMKMCS